MAARNVLCVTYRHVAAPSIECASGQACSGLFEIGEDVLRKG